MKSNFTWLVLSVVGAGSFASCASAPPAAPSVAQPVAAPAAQPPAPATPANALTERVKAWRALPGLFPLYWDEKKGELWLEIGQLESDFLYVTSVTGGLGSNDVGLDRNKLGQDRVVRFVRSGPRVLLVQRNLAFRASSPDAAEQRAVEDSFASSVIAGFEVGAEDQGRVLVNATEFFLRDGQDVIGTLKETRQGSFKLDGKRSAVWLPQTKNFPRNTEVEVLLTFTSEDPGAFVREVAPDAKAVTLRQRHSLIALPDPGYAPRRFDPRAGFFPTTHADYSAAIGEPLRRQYLTRHRLEKKDPAEARSEPIKPIVYYVDAGTPEPIRSALVEGARWWSDAFEAAGFVNAFRVELLPPDADPMDVRYNMIHWVHRSTRGWSYGSSITDPRTGEIIKGNVTLGSLRVRQDYLIAEGLLAPHEDGREVPPEMEEMALARLRQLSAHEVGHTLGLAHNYIASTANRASVMDYPHPYVRVRPDRSLDLGEAYASGIGEWDKVAISCGYAQFAAGTDEAVAVDALLRTARERGLVFLSDQDARPPGGAHPLAHLWDSGTNPIDELNRMLDVRAAALARFGPNVVRPGRPLAAMEDALVPVYLAHRYQIEAAAKLMGGLAYTYALRGDGQVPLAPVPGLEQQRALDSLLGALAPKILRLPDAILDQLPPPPLGFGGTREHFKRRTGVVFDAIAPAEAAAELTFSLLFHPQRASRLVQQNARNSQLPGLEAVIAATLAATWRQPAGIDYEGEIRRAVAQVALNRLFTLAADPAAAPQVVAVVMQHLSTLRGWLASNATSTSEAAQRAHLEYGSRRIAQFMDNPQEFAPAPVPPVPPGQPIGDTLSCDF